MEAGRRGAGAIGSGCAACASSTRRTSGSSDYLVALEHIEERLRAFDAQVEQTSLDPRYASAVAALRCFRGIDTLTAIVPRRRAA